MIVGCARLERPRFVGERLDPTGDERALGDDVVKGEEAAPREIVQAAAPGRRLRTCRRLQSTSPSTAKPARARASAIQPQGVSSVDDAGSAVVAVVVGTGMRVVSVSTVVTVDGGSVTGGSDGSVTVVVTDSVVDGSGSVGDSLVLVGAVSVGVVRVTTGPVSVRAGLVAVRPVPVVSALSPPPHDPRRKPATARAASGAARVSSRSPVTARTLPHRSARGGLLRRPSGRTRSRLR